MDWNWHHFYYWLHYLDWHHLNDRLHLLHRYHFNNRLHLLHRHHLFHRNHFNHRLHLLHRHHFKHRSHLLDGNDISLMLYVHNLIHVVSLRISLSLSKYFDWTSLRILFDAIKLAKLSDKKHNFIKK